MSHALQDLFLCSCHFKAVAAGNRTHHPEPMAAPILWQSLLAIRGSGTPVDDVDIHHACKSLLPSHGKLGAACL